MQQDGTIRWGSAASFDVGQSAGAAAMVAGNLGLGQAGKVTAPRTQVPSPSISASPVINRWRLVVAPSIVIGSAKPPTEKATAPGCLAIPIVAGPK